MAKFLDFIIHNFEHVAPILAAAGFAIVISFERARALIWSYPFPYADAFFEKVRNMVMADRIGEAIAFCERFRSKPVANVVKEGLVRAHQPEALIEHGLQLAVGQALEKTSARTGFLATIANVATLLGLLGTIVGLIQSFEAVGNANAQQRSALLAAGISTAMNATMMGLFVAIPCMCIFSYLMAKTNKLNAQIEQAAVRTMDLLQQRYYAPELESAQAMQQQPQQNPNMGNMNMGGMNQQMGGGMNQMGGQQGSMGSMGNAQPGMRGRRFR